MKRTELVIFIILILINLMVIIFLSIRNEDLKKDIEYFRGLTNNCEQFLREQDL